MKRTLSILGGLGGLFLAACVIPACSSDDNSGTGGGGGSTAGAGGAMAGSGGSLAGSGGSQAGSGGSQAGAGGSQAGAGGSQAGAGGSQAGAGGSQAGAGGSQAGAGGTTEAGTPETGTPETGTPETGTPETGTPDTGGSSFDLAGWKATCTGTNATVTSGNWIAGADSYQGTTAITSPCTGGAGAKCPPTPVTCTAGGRAGAESVHITGTKAKGSIYAGFNFGAAPGTPTGSKGIKFWYKTAGAANGGKVQIDLGLTDDILVTDWAALGLGTCLAPGYDYNLNQCWNNPIATIPAAADWTEVTVLWSDFTVIPYSTTIPAWWAGAQAAMDTHVIFARIGVLSDTDRAGDGGAIAGGAVDIWIDDVTLVAK